MNFSFYIYGIPDGYKQYPLDTNSEWLQKSAQNSNTDSQLTVRRDKQLIYYAYSRKILSGNSNDYLGFCLVFNGSYCYSIQKVFNLFDSVYNDVEMNGVILKYEKKEIYFAISQFANNQDEIERINSVFKTKLDEDFKHDFTAILPAFKLGNGTKTISLKESNENILDAITDYDCVHISNSEKSQTEVERAHKLLSDVYAEKRELNNKYHKLVAQKKQYNVVFILLFAIIICCIALFSFNKSLQSRDSQINNLNSTVEQQQSDIENLNTNIEQLEVERKNLTSKNSKLTNEVSQLSYSNKQLNTEISNKNNIISNIESQNESCQNENDYLRSKNRSLSSDVETYKTYVPQTYYVKSNADYYYKYRCNRSYEETNCYISSGNYITVYTTENGYGLTGNGWVKLSYLSKY